MEEFAQSSLRSPGKHTGSLICRCGDVSWGHQYQPEKQRLLIASRCAGTLLPVYVGPPRSIRPEATIEYHEHPCSFSKWSKGLHIAIAIGYPGEVPPLGNVEVERGQEIVVAAYCPECEQQFILWRLSLPSPPDIARDDPWLQKIQGYKERTLWEKLPPKEQAKHPDTPPEDLSDLAEQFPEETLANPLLPMVALESPRLWEQINYKARASQYRDEIKSRIEALPEEKGRAWRLSCCLGVLQRYSLFTDEEKATLREECQQQSQEAFGAKRVSPLPYSAAAMEAWREAQDQRRAKSERDGLYHKAMQEHVRSMVYASSSLHRFVESAVDIATYHAAVNGTSGESAALDEYRWLLSLLDA